MPVLIIAALAAAAVAATAGAISQHEAEQKAMDILNRARDSFGNISLPTVEQLAGKELGPTALSSIQADPRFKSVQYAALDKLGDMAKGGLSVSDQATLNQSLGKVNQGVNANRNALLNNMAARGALGSGAELAMNLQGQQDAAQRANQSGMDAYGKAQSRAYDALLNQSQLAGQMHSQDYAEKSKAAQAQDLINKYNATRMSDATQQRFSDEMARTAGMNGMTPQMVQSARNQGQINSNVATGIGTAATQAGTAAAQNYQVRDGISAAPAGQVDSSQFIHSQTQGPGTAVNFDEEEAI